MIVYLDTFALLFRSYYAIPGLTSKDGTPTGALYGLTNTLFRIINEIEPDHIIACLDRPEITLRQQADESYKANRNEAEQDMIIQIELAREILESYGVHVVEKEGYEADDLLGTLAKQDTDRGEEVLIVTCDGDILQLTTNPNIRVYFLRRGMSDFVIYDEKESEKRNGYPTKYIIDYKGLAGDSSDNIKGVSGIGTTYATRLILKYGNLEEIYKALDDGRVEKDFTKRIVSLLTNGRKDAFSSRDLATIHIDVPIKLPHAKSSLWKEKINLLDAEETLDKYGFSSLKKRLIIISNREKDVVKKLKEVKNSDPKFVNRVAIALWVLDASHTNATEDEILAYTKTESIEEAWEVIQKKLKEEKLNNIWKDIEEPLIPIIENIENIGVKLDVNAAKKLSKEYKAKLEKLTKNIYKLAGDEFNINSPKQLGGILYDNLGLVPKSSKKTSSGARTTKEAVLVTLEHPIIPLILEYRHLEKLRSTYVDALPGYVDDNNRIHAKLIQNGTTTGRFSSRNPNVQNIPVEMEEGFSIRDLFIAKEGYELVAIDYSQMELRIAAILSKDPMLLETFRKNGDVHTTVAAQMFNITKNEVTKDQRNNAKAINFGILYGMGASSLQQHFKTTRSEAQLFLETYKKALPTLFEYLDSIKKNAKETGVIHTAFGRERSIEGIYSSLAFVRAQAERVATSSVIQGTGADIIKIAMAKINLYLKKEGYSEDARMVLQIHDEIVFEIRPEIFNKVVPRIINIMESIYPENNNPLSLPVEVKRGKSWGSLT